MNDPARDSGAAVGIPVDRTVRPLAPVGWRYVPSEVCGDQVLTQDPKVADLARQFWQEAPRLAGLPELRRLLQG